MPLLPIKCLLKVWYRTRQVAQVMSPRRLNIVVYHFMC